MGRDSNERVPADEHRAHDRRVQKDLQGFAPGLCRPRYSGRRAEQIFDNCWLYLGHSSELAKPGDFVTRQVGGRSILFTRDAQGNLKALLNTCPHRGAQVCREKGNAKSFQCFYHGWVFGLDGTLRSQPGETSYAEDFKERTTSRMLPVPRFESYRDFHFIWFDPGIESLSDYLGPVREYLDVICDQAEAGMTMVGGTQEYSIRANWKLLTENSIDGYHALTTHATYLDYLKSPTAAWRRSLSRARLAISARAMPCSNTTHPGAALSRSRFPRGARRASASFAAL